MSKIKIQGDAGGTGIFTVAAPATNTDRTLTLPDLAGTILTSSSSINAANVTGTLSSSSINAANVTGGTLPKAIMPTGSILQVVNFQENGRYSYSGDWHNTALTAQITPISASSKILVQIHLGRVAHYEGNTLAFRMTRNGTLIGVGASYGSRQRTSAVIMRITTDSNHTQGALHLTAMDSPATTSALTYVLQANAEGNATWYLNRNGSNTDGGEQYNSTSQSNITLMEIAG